MGKIILVPIDGSRLALHALTFAMDMASAFGDELLLLNVQKNIEALGLPAIEEASALIKDAVPFRTKIRTGFPAIEIMSEAHGMDLRCIVMGSKGAGGKDGKFGSVAEETLQLTKCPIVIIPSKE